MPILNNTNVDRYSIENFFEFNEEIQDYDILSNPVLMRTIKELPKSGVIDGQNIGVIRLDQLSYELYSTTSLWWFLAIYNDIIDIFNNTRSSLDYPSLDDVENWYFLYRDQIVK